MLLSLNWLSDHVDLEGLDPADVAERLTMRTALIEGLHDQRATLDGVVAGEVIECMPHPSADRLSLCVVAWGGSEPARVVCGAPNVRTGQKVLYAPVGTKLPNGLKLRKAKIRGEPSFGMICAEDELDLGPEHEGILVLDEGTEVGTPAGELKGLADVVFEIDNKSINHRPDLWGHRGFARELAAVFGRELRPLDLDTALCVGEEGPSIELVEGSACGRYAGWCVDIPSVPSPDWMRFRLHACGMRPIRLAVDLSNYVMLELGQPTHPFDRDRLQEDRIVVRTAAPAEVLRTLDGIDRSLEPEDTVIADGGMAVALAGIMGCQHAEVAADTEHVFLESASFDARCVRRTSGRLGLRSEALARFEKSLDPALVEQAIRRYAALVRDLCPAARPAGTFRMVGSASAPVRNLALSGELVRSRLGTSIDDAEIEAALAALGFGVARTAGGGFDVDVPSWRSTRDIALVEDLVEEVGRLVDYARVLARPPVGPLRPGTRDPLFVVEEVLRNTLARVLAFTEIETYSMVSDGDLGRVGFPQDVSLPRLANPRQQDASRLRPSLVPGILARLEGWLRHGEEVRIFEVGRGYGLEEDGSVVESRQAVALLARRVAGDSRQLVRELWGLARTALEAMGQGGVRIGRWEPGRRSPWFHPLRAAVLALGKVEVGHLGAVSPRVLQELGVEGAAGLVVLNVRALSESDAGPKSCERISRHPPARMDLAFVIDYGTTVEDLAACICAAGPRSLVHVDAFDVYRGPPLKDDERSVAFHLLFQADDRTLTDEEVTRARDRIVMAAGKVGARLR